jgi:large subunit ribosomal protein L22
MVTATLTNYRQSPRKVRLVANLVKGQKVDSALIALTFLSKRSALPVRKLILSAVANAKHNSQIEQASLFVKDLRVDQGVTLKRMMPRARGSAARINKRSSHLLVVLDDVSNMKMTRKARRMAAKAKSKAEAPKVTAK